MDYKIEKLNLFFFFFFVSFKCLVGIFLISIQIFYYYLVTT